MMPVYFSSALGTLSPQNNVADYRYILIKGNMLFAILAMRTGEYYGLLFRNAVNKHIKETAESRT
jgi:hypothetical protein